MRGIHLFACGWRRRGTDRSLTLDWTKVPHRRFNPLTGEWVLVSPHRNDRPWQGATESAPPPRAPIYDPQCYLCPGNERARGVRNPHYTSTFVFDNDFPALLPGTPYIRTESSELLVAETEKGICRVACFSPRHDLTIARMSNEAVTDVVNLWCEQYSALGELPDINHVQIFENRGQMMGASNPHPHCQIWANASIPDETKKETDRQNDYGRRNSACLLCDYLAIERGGERVVSENESFAVVVPFWAVWPFETLIIGKRHTAGLDQLTAVERSLLAGILRDITSRYDTLFHIPFPYSMGFHQRPTDGGAHEAWHLHAHYFPPLLRSAAIRKFMVGYEMLAGPQRDFTPEMAAVELKRAVDHQA
jgi:UDPglucose--hexose-1-phosphate uridylyltransferase